MSRRNRSRILFVLILVLFVVSNFYRLPYYVQKAGTARELQQMIEVEGGYKNEGKLMLTTVRMGQANIYTYALAKFKKYEDLIPIEEVRPEEESEEEYHVRQLYNMEHSKHNAIQMAYRKANKPYHFTYKGVYVLHVKKDMPAADILKAGDRITKLDGHKFTSSEQFINYLKDKQAGDVVKVTFIRKDKEQTKEIKLSRFDHFDEERVGLGIGLVDDRELSSDPPVKLESEEIGGPSAGLMFSLEIYNQLTKKDYTHGYQIAGTGTISPEGEVGRIGGIHLKVIAADKAGADIFFAPDDEIDETMKKQFPGMVSNYEEALATAKEIGTDMKIIPVKTFDDAIAYLESLEEGK